MTGFARVIHILGSHGNLVKLNLPGKAGGPDRKLLNRQPLLYPATRNSQELVFGGYHAHHASAAADSSSQGLAGLR